MGKYFVSGLLAGVTAAVIWTSCSLMAKSPDLSNVGLWALIFLVAVTIVTMVISSIVARNRAGAPRQ